MISTKPSLKGTFLACPIERPMGCINVDNINFNCYCFQQDKVITDEGFPFPQDTYVYGEQIAIYNLQIFTDVYTIEEVDYEIIGKLTNKEFRALIECIRNSRTVKRKIRRKLGSKI